MAERLPDELESVARVRHRVAGVESVKPRRAINWPATVTTTDDPINEETEIAISGVVPGGSAGGVLDGTYPNPGLAAGVAGDGLTETSNVLSVNAGTGLELSSDALRISAAAAGDGLTGGGGSALAVAPGTGLENSSDTVRIAAAAAGNGLTGGGGSALAVNPDGTSIDISGDAVRRMALSGDITAAAGSGSCAITSGVIVSGDFNSEAPTAWTPGVTGAWSVSGAGGIFVKHGRAYWFSAAVEINATEASALGITGFNTAGSDFFGSGKVVDASTSIENPITWAIFAGTGTAFLYAHKVDSTYATLDVVTSAIPFTWAAGDLVFLSGSYIATT